MDERIAVNRLRWDEMARLHETTYFREGAAVTDATLTPFELEDLGDLTGQRVCHLQCHIGGDTLSLARLGATVVGVDFSEFALDVARRRAREAGLGDRVEFVCASVDEAASVLGAGGFDGVHTSWGVLCWLPDLTVWAATIRDLLRPGGWLELAETHPHAAALRWAGPTYGGGTPSFDDAQGDYTQGDAVFEHPGAWEWQHGLGEIVTALAAAGMRIDHLHEHPCVVWHLNDRSLVRRPDGLWEVPGSTLPLSFTLRATRS